LIVRLQDANKIGHAGSIAVFGHNRNPSIGRGLAPLPNPEQEIGDVFHGALSATNRGSGNQLLQRQRAARSGKAGGRYAAGLVLQLPARGPVPLLCLLHSQVAPGTRVTLLHAGMK
jgi:hypothetical protein